MEQNHTTSKSLILTKNLACIDNYMQSLQKSFLLPIYNLLKSYDDEFADPASGGHPLFVFCAVLTAPVS
jgi:hypothetical protein